MSAHNGGGFLKQLNKKTNRKIICIVLAIIMLISLSTVSVFAKSNNWGLVTSQINTSYFHEYIDMNGWSSVRERCYVNANTLTSSFNIYVVDTDNAKNVIYQMEYIYDKSGSRTATAYSDRWNNLYADLVNLTENVKQLCGGGPNVPVINGKEVTTEAYQNLVADIATKTSELNVLVSDINSSYASAQYQAVDITSQFNGTNYNIFTTLWNQLGLFITSIGNSSDTSAMIFGVSWTSDNIKNIANTVSPIVKSFAYFIACVLFGINVSRSALQFELMETKGVFKIFARVLLIKIWIDLSITICIYIINIISSLTKQIVSEFTYNTFAFTTFTSSIGDATANDSFNGIGALINFLYQIFLTLPYSILCIVLIVSIISVIIKLIARGFEMTALVTVSPIFFATLVGEETRMYFKKFISAFLSTCCSLFFIAIVYAVATIWINDSTVITDTSLTSIVSAFGNSFGRCLIVLAACRIIRKPPKVLVDLLS